MTSKTTVLITGANRGIGRGLVQCYLSRPDHTVIAAVRNPEHATSKALNYLPKGKGSSLVLVKIDSASATDAAHAVKELETTYGIAVLDIVVANAGIAKCLPRVNEIKAEDMLEHFSINVLGVIYLFQAVLPLLNKSSIPKFITMSSVAATLGGMRGAEITNTPYSTSKTALNHVTRKIHFENTNLIAFPIHPGLVATEMGSFVFEGLGMNAFYEQNSISVDESVTGMVKIIDAATREKTSGEFLSYDGGTVPW